MDSSDERRAGCGFNPSLDENFSFCNFCLICVPRSLISRIQMKSSTTLIRDNRCKEKRIFFLIWRRSKTVVYISAYLF